MTAKQMDLQKRASRLAFFLFDSEQRALSDHIKLGRYAQAYNLIRTAEGRSES